MSSQIAQTSRTAEPPFHGAGGSDITLRTPDGTDFHVHKLILGLASTVFETMFTLPQPTSDISARDRPVIDVEESGKVLDPLLRTCYPVVHAELNNIIDVVAVLDAATKYEMQHASTIMKTRFKELIADNPLRAWALACDPHRALEEEAQLAAQAQKANGYKPEHDDIMEIDTLPAFTFIRLIYFRSEGSIKSFCIPPLVTMHPPTPALSVEPFRSTDADIALRAPDGMIFHVHFLVISLTSAPLVTLAQRAKHDVARAHGWPVIDFSEDSRTLRNILVTCYPGTDGVPDVPDLDSLRLLLFAGKRYAVKRPEVWGKVQLEKYIVKRARSVYYLSVALGWDALALEAALHIVQSPRGRGPLQAQLQPAPEVPVEEWELRGISAVHTRRLSKLMLESSPFNSTVPKLLDSNREEVRQALRKIAQKVGFSIDS